MDPLDGLEAADAGQLKIHERDIRPLFAEHHYRFFTRRCRADDVHVGLHLDDEGNALADHRMIVDAQHANRR